MKRISSWLLGFTLVEVLASTLIVTVVTIAWFYWINAVWLGKVKLVEKTQLEQQAFYFSERFFELVKQGGTLDYEEYFNRQNIDNTNYLSGHYLTPTWFWNRSNEMIYCLSWDGDPFPVWNGCITSYNSSGATLTGLPLLYGQYAQQFIDYNSDADNDWGDENADGDIVNDDDDLFLGRGPNALDPSWQISEIYLVDTQSNTRTFFRFFVSEDPDRPSWATCDFSDHSNPTGSWCLWTIQFLKLKWVDWWHDHVIWNVDATQNDGIIDTWVYDAGVYGLPVDTVADLTSFDSENYWLPIFSDGVNVEEFDVYAFPPKDNVLSWADTSFIPVSPYLRVSMKLLPSWKNKRQIQWSIPEIEINTTINLSSQ